MRQVRRYSLKIRKLLFRILNREFLIFLFFLFLSTAFWIFISLDDEYEQDFAIPLRLRNVPENVVITTDLPRTIRVSLKDKGAMLLHYRYGQGFSPITVDFTVYDNHSGHVKVLTSDLTKQLISQLAPTTRLVTFRPDTLEYYYNYGLSKRVPVNWRGDVRTGGLYNLSNVKIEPETVMMYANQPMFSNIRVAPTHSVYRQGLTENTSINVDLASIKGVKFEPSKVKVTFLVDQMTEKTVQVPVQWVNFPATKTLRTFPPKVNVTFQVGTGMYRRINAGNFILVVKYEELLQNKTNKCHLSLKTIPAGASHVRINPQDVEYLIEDVPSED